ncbi:hypothetical protein EGH21_03035 [Halomicroarcula sp. F13]|uniref:Uncharacterized protein n=1 Tax=Haloarcula rubra TaxID=2487747 RepID=A0AAW4PLJ4_9EURY|nr:hypothetical protein [Halomicroarcula rubra]MBX0322000.1 hypothetical protein [Halomicroarcula rubra]
MRRRRLLTALGAAPLAVAGCLSSAPSAGADLPEDCPTSQNLGVEWPEQLDASTVESFVERYEGTYYREVVVDYEPETRLDAYALHGSVTDPPTRRGDGWVVSYSGSGGVYRPTLLLEAETGEAPEGITPVPVASIDNAPLTETLREAAETGSAQLHVESPDEQYLDMLDATADHFDGPAGRGDTDTLYVDVDGTTVELSVKATNFHGDYWWSVRYYVDERVVRRAADEETAPRNGTLLECRPLE